MFQNVGAGCSKNVYEKNAYYFHKTVIQNCFVLPSFQLYKGRINATSHMIQHPMYGAGHKYRTLHLPISTTLAEVLDRVSGMFQYKKT